MIRDIVLFKPRSDNSMLTSPIDEKDYSDKEVREKLHETLEENRIHHKGLGIAANQLGLPDRAFNIEGKTYFNPKVIGRAEDSYEPFSEGCLSFLSVRATIRRANQIQVSYMDIDGNVIEEELDGIDAIAFQHELDHLEGITMVDNIDSNIQKKKFMEKYKKALKKHK